MHHVRSVVLSVVLAGVASVTATATNVDLPRYPSVSPDGDTVVFSWRGDLWKVPSSGGEAIRLTSHPNNDLASAWSADGRRIAFESTRDGYRNVYMMNADGTDVTQVTETDRALALTGFGRDEDGAMMLTLSSSREPDLYRSPRPYHVPVEGGPIERLHDAYGSEPAVSPDGRRVLFTRGGSSWGRRHYRGPDSRDVWLFDRGDGSFRQLTSWEGNDGAARWADDQTVLFLSDRADDTVNVWKMTLAGDSTATPVTSFRGRDVVAFDVSDDGDTLVLQNWDRLYRLDPRGASPRAEEIVITASEDEGDRVEIRDVSSRVSEAQLSPDGKVMAFVAFGDVYVKGVEDKAPTRAITRTESRERGIAWSPDGLRLYYTTDQDGTDSIWAAEVEATRDEVRTASRKALSLEVEEEESEEEPEAEPTEDEPAEETEEESEPEAIVDDGLSGDWSFMFVGIPDAPAAGLPVTASFTLNGGSVTGSFSSPMGNADIVSGSYDPASGELELSIELVGAGMAGTIVGTVANGSFEGRLTMNDGTLIEVDGSRTAVGGGGDDDDDDEKGGGAGGKKKKAPKDPRLDPSRWQDAVRFEVMPVVRTDANDRDPSPSPDGRHLAFRRGRGDLMLLDLESGAERPFVSGWDASMGWAWSPDGHRIAYSQSDRNFNSDIHVAPVDGSSPPVNITRHPDNDFRPRWSADGKILVFLSERTNEEIDVWRVYLDKELEAKTALEMDAYYKDAVSAAKKRKPLTPKGAEPEKDESKDDSKDGDDEKAEDQTKDDAETTDDEAEMPELDLDDAWRRVRRVTRLTGNEGNVEITPGGDRIVFTSSGENGGLYSVKWDGSDQKRLGGSGRVQQMTPTGDRLVFLAGGRANTVKPGGGGAKAYSPSARIVVDRQELSRRKFAELARVLGEMFYHPRMKDLDWDGLTEQYMALAGEARTSDEFNWVANRFLGELNASHLGVRAPGPPASIRQSRGRLGATLSRIDLDGRPGYRIDGLLPESPAATSTPPFEIGDVITAIEFEPLEGSDTVEGRLAGHVGREIAVTAQRTDEDGEIAEFTIFVEPVSWGAIRSLAYEDYQERARQAVDELSGGRLGYIHIQGMNQPSLDEFERDLFAAAEGRDGLIIDVRNNGGGWTADRLLASITTRPHAYTIPRGMDPSITDGYPQDRLFIQRYALPMSMLCNEKSFSNAEIVSHAFKNLNRGTLVGQQTYGGVISTGGFSLLDGTTVRLPFRGWYLMDGTDMENNGAMPDLVVEQTPEAESAGRDEQLKAAVEELLGRLN